MGLGLYLHGDCDRQRDALLEEIREHVRQTHSEILLSSRIGLNEAGHRALWLSLHPAEEEVELSALGLSRLVASARTSGAGPGYHAFVCDLLDELGKKFSVRWQGIDPTGETGDETGYFHDRDRAKLEAEMRGWLRGVAQTLAGSDLVGVAMSMPVDAPVYEVPGVVTALGPRDCAWWKRVADDDAAAREFFAWWEPGTGAGYYLGRAMCRMWCDVCWREPRTDEEREVHEEVLELLRRAHELEPQRPLPVSAWAELLALRSEATPEGLVDAGTGTIGYRRGSMLAHPFPGATIRIPGPFSTAYDKKGNWSAWEDGRTVWASLVTATKLKEGGAVPQDEPEPRHETTEEDGDVMHKVFGKRVRRDGEMMRALFVSIVFTSKQHVEWAKETYRSAVLE